MASKKIPRPKKVDSFFKGSPVEKLLVADIYKESPDPDNILNSFQSLATKAKSEIAKVVKIPKLNAKDLVGLLDLKNGIRIDRNALSQRMMESVGIRQGEIPENAKDSIFKSFESYLGMEDGVMRDTLGKAWDLKDNPPEDVSGFVDFLNGYLGDDSAISGMVDSSPILGFLKGSVQTAVKLGLPDAMDALISKVTDENERIAILCTQIQTAALAADIPMLKAIGEYMSKEDILANCPELVQYILSGFRISRLRPDTTLEDYYLELVTYFDEIDPHWILNGTRTKLDCFSRASSDALTVFQTIGDYRTEALIARSWPQRDIIQTIKSNYPNSTIIA